MTPAELKAALEKQIEHETFSLSPEQAQTLGWTAVETALDGKTLEIAGSDAKTAPVVTALADAATVAGPSTFNGEEKPVWVVATFALAPSTPNAPSGLTVAGPVDSLYETLLTFVKDEVFTLTAADATAQGWTDAATLLTAYAPSAGLTVDGEDATTPPVVAKATGAVTVTGKSAAFFAGQSATTPLDVVATFTPNEDAPPDPALAVVASLDATWTFGKSFASFAGLILDKFEFTGADTGETATLTLDADGLAFSGKPALNVGPLGDLSWLFEGLTGKQVPNVSGPIDIADPAKPALSLTFPADLLPTVPLGPVKAQLQLTLYAGAKGYSASLAPTFTLSSHDVTLVADLSKKPYTFELSIPPFEVPGISALDALAPGTAIETFVPNDLKLPKLVVDGLTFDAKTGKDGGITKIAGTLALKADTSWTIIAGAIVVAAGSLELEVAYDEKTAAWDPSLTVAGTFAIGSGEPPPASVDVTVKLPAQTLTGTLTPDTKIELLTLLAQFLGAAGISFPTASFGLDKLTIDKLDVAADGKKKTFHLELDASTTWQFTLPPIGPTFALEGVSVTFDRTTNAAPLSLSADVSKPIALTAAGKREDAGKGWMLSLTQTEPYATTALVNSFGDASWVVGAILPSTIDGIALTLDTATGAYTLAGSATWNFTLPVGGEPFTVDASLELASEYDETVTPKKRTYTGTLTGALTIFSFKASVAYRFGPDDKNITYTIVFRGATLTAVRATTKESDTLTITLTGVTVGEIIEELVNLVVPNLGFSLPAPWDALSSVSLDGVSLVADLMKKTVGVTASIGLDLGFATINAVTLTYGKAKDGAPSVAISVDGSFVGWDAPISWDLLNDPAPTPPAASPPVVDLALLALGQNYGFTEATAPSTIQEVIAALEREFDEDGPGSGLAFTGDGNWLVGLDITLMGAVALQVIFDDPVLYGVRIALSGDKVKALAGLQFEILYRRITDTLGVYHIELTLPDKFRQLQFGAVSVTVPVIDIDIYTNGNFRLDFGFPAGGDFSRSLCVQAGPFIGYGGFYFALLDGQTSTTVPKVINGSFSPVIEFGFGLSLGLGRTFTAGPLSAGATITFQAMLEGTLGWFNPTDRSQPTALFYHIEGTAALVGHVYGSVDLVIISIDVDILAKAQVSIVAESYQAIELRFTAEVEVSASVKIVFFTVHLSWGMSLDLSTTIGSGSTPPWQLAGGSQNAFTDPRRGPVLRQQRPHQRPRRMRSRHLLALDAKHAPRGAAPIDWTPVAVFPGSAVQPVRARSIPVITVAASGEAAASLRVVASFFVDNAIDPNARTLVEVRNAAGASGPSSFDLLAQGVLRWSFAAAGVTGLTDESGSARVTSLALAQLLENVQSAAAREAAFSYDNVAGPTGFLAANYAVGFGPPQFDEEQSGSVTVFPIPAAFSIVPSDGPPIDLWNTACVDADYRNAFETYYGQLRVDPSSSAGGADPNVRAQRLLHARRGYVRAASLPPGCAEGTTPLSAVTFGDYFAVLAKTALQSASDLMTSYPYDPSPDDSFGSVADAFGGGDAVTLVARGGDTLASLSAALGIEPHVVVRANGGPRSLAAGLLHAPLRAGAEITVPAGPTVGTIAAANKNVPLRPGTLVTIEDVLVQVASAQTMAGIAATFGFGPTAVFADTSENAASTALLRPGAGLTIPPLTYVITADDMAAPADPLDRVGAVYYVRAGGALGATAAQYVPWYAQQIGASGPTGVGGTYVIPIASLTGGTIVAATGATGATTSYVVRDELDTIERVAQYFTLIQLDAARPQGFTDFVDAIGWSGNLGPGTPLQIPAQGYGAAANDSLAAIAARFSAGSGALGAGAVVAQNAYADVLQPLAVVHVPPFETAILRGDTLATIAQRYDLTVESLAESVAGTTGIFVAGPTGTLTIPDVASREVDELLADMTRLGKINELASSVSRFLLNGMRVAPAAQTGDWTPSAGLYDVLGQQLTAPAGATFTMTFTAGEAAPWIGFSGPSGQTASSLEVTLGATFIAANAPSTTFDPQLIGGPTGMTPYADVPVRYPAPQSAHWQAAAAPALGYTGPAPNLAGQPSLWYFGPSLLDVTAALTGATFAGGGTGPFQLVAAPKDAPPAAAASAPPLQQYAFAMTVELRIQRALASDGSVIPNRYLLIGADETGRDLLLNAWRFASADAFPSDQLVLLYPPSGGANASGFASDAVVADDVFVLRTNLSTVTRPNLMLLAANALGDDTSVYHATIADTAAFLQTVWEASITGNGGYYLEYASKHGDGFPDALFTDDPTAKIRLVYLSGDQTTYGDRYLYAFNNCAVVADNVDSGSTVFLELEPGVEGPVRRIATIPAGTVGFELARTKPSGDDPLDRTRALYDVLSYRVAGNAYFGESHFGAPVMPVSPTGMTGQWQYRKVVPVAQFGIANDAPAATGADGRFALPAPSGNPYAGIAFGPTGIGPLSTAHIELAFDDVFGNDLGAGSSVGAIDVPAGYVDDIIAVSSWPGAGLAYRFTPAGPTGALLSVDLSLDTTRSIASSALSVASATASATADALRYASIFYQVQQRDLRFALDCNLGTPQQQGDELKAPLAAFVVKAKLFVDAASSLDAVMAYQFGGPATTFGDMARWHAVTPGALFEANPGAGLYSVFTSVADGVELFQPVFFAAPSGSTLEALLARGGSAGYGSVLDLVEANANVPLRAGAVLYAGTARTVGVDPQQTPTLAATARATSSAVYFANAAAGAVTTGLVPDNWTTPALVAANLPITIGKTSIVTPSAPSSFAEVYAQFAAAGIDAGTFANGIAAVAGLWAPSVTALSSKSYVVPPPVTAPLRAPRSTTFGTLPSAIGTLPDVVTANAAVPDLFPDGITVQIGQLVARFPDVEATFADAAHATNLTLAELGTANATHPLRSIGTIPPHVDVVLGLPGAVEMRNPGWAAYTPAPADTMQSITGLFAPQATADDLVAFATLNRYLRGILTPGTITVGGTQYAVSAGDSLDTLAARAGGFDAFIPAAKDVAGLFWSASAVVVPVPVIPAGLTLQEVAQRFGLTGTGAALALFRTNRSLLLFLAEQTLTIPAPIGATIAVGQFDTADTLVRRLLDEQGIAVTIEDLCAAVAGVPGLLNAGQPFVLPPNPTLIATELAPVVVPPPGANTSYPVSVALSMSRSPSLIAPAFAGASSAVGSVATSVVPAAFASGATGATASGTLRAFASDFEAAFAPQRLKCAVGEVAAAGGTDQSSIYAVDFGPKGIAQIAIDANSPAFYALPPISTQLVSGTYDVVPYPPGGPSGPTSIQDGDPQSWLETFLSAVDLMLSPPYAAQAYLVAGPTAFDAIVASKLTVASALSEKVEPILEGVTGSDGAARDALYQQMLVELASAYRTTAVVQYPVGVIAPPPAGATIAPRLFGPVSTETFRLPEGPTGPTGLAAFASGLGVSPSYLALLVAGQRGILAPGSTVDYGGASYVVRAGDTLIDVAARFGVPFPGPTGSAPEGWWTESWTPFIEGPLGAPASGIAAQPLIGAATPLPVTAIARGASAGEPFTGPAGFFGDPIAFGRANQDLGAMFAPGGAIAGPAGATYTTTGAPAETIRTIAADAGYAIDELVNVIESSAVPLGLQARTLYGAALTSGFTLSSTKLSLAPNAQAYLTYLLSVADASAARTLFLGTRFAPSDLEYGIATVPNAGDYEASSWLRFVIPPDTGFLPGTVMPQAQVPIPLRTYPAPPLLTGNQGTQERTNPTTIDDAKLWSYAFDVLRSEAPQDQDHVAVSFYRSTRPGFDARGRFAPSRSLIRALAQFAIAWPQLRDDLAPLARSASPPQTSGAIGAFVFYAQAIASAMSLGRFESRLAADGGDLAEYYQFLAERAPGTDLTRLTLTWEGASGPGASANAPWPEIAIFVPGASGPSGPTALAGPSVSSATTAVYRYPDGIAAAQQLTQRYTFAHRDVTRNERASGGAFVTRNADLIGSGPLGVAGPTGAYATNASFVYQTPLVEFVNPLVPSLTCSAAIDLAGATQRTLADLLARMLFAITSDAVADGLSTHWIEVLCSYQFSTSGGAGGVPATIPFGLRPTPYDGLQPAEYAGYANELAALVEAALPPGVLGTANKSLSFSVRLFTSIPDPAGFAAELKPVLSYDNLYVAAGMIRPGVAASPNQPLSREDERDGS